MGLSGSVKSFDIKPLYSVEIDGFPSADFSKCTGLEVEIEPIHHYEGGSLVPHKQPGLVKFSQITLERGVGRDNSFFNWVTSVVALSAAGAGAANTGLPTPLYKRGAEIVQRDRDGSVLKRWGLFGAWPCKFTAGEWDSSSNEVVIEILTLEVDFWDRVL